MCPSRVQKRYQMQQIHIYIHTQEKDKDHEEETKQRMLMNEIRKPLDIELRKQ